ncbi:MAG: STAS domain-containing protein [Gammaproteobacteria bacterium]|nr:STAS domain-containing protein [Gammaproteobacteria bacterium]MCG3142772.1 hypothetical protein [Gammaproteobacteria bacterium]
MNTARLVKGDGQTFFLDGDVALATVPSLLAQSRELWAGDGDQVIDMSRVRRIDSSSLALMLEWARAARAGGGSVRFRSVPGQVLAVARLCGVETLLPVDSAGGP